MTKESSSNEKDVLIAELNELMKTRPQPRYSYKSNEYKTFFKVLTGGGMVVIIGLLMYLIGKDSARDKNYRCDV